MPIFQREEHKAGLQTQSVAAFPIFFYGAICSFTHFSGGGTLSTAHILFIIPLLYILENTNQNEVSESDHAVTQKVTQPFLLLSSCFLSIFSG